MLPTGVDEIVYCGYLANYWIGFTFFEFYCGKSLFGFARAMAVSLLFGFGWMVYAGLDFNGRELRCNCTSAVWLRPSACPEVYLIEETLFMWTTLHVTLGARSTCAVADFAAAGCNYSLVPTNLFCLHL